MNPFGKKEGWALAAFVLLLIPSLFLNLGIVPLYVEEPRRAAVALEMILRGNWLVPTINGEFYHLKPPFFNWILAAVYRLSGDQSEFITRLPTVASLIAFGLVIFWSGKKFVGTAFGALSALLFVTAAGNLFFNSLLAEIDIFYSLITYSALIILYHYSRRKKYLLLFLLVYLLGAVGTLTKGLPSLLFTGLSLLAFFAVNREFRKLFSFPHLAGILLYLAIVGGYFLAYSQKGDAIKYLLSLSVESGKRLSGDTPWDYFRHMLLYPLDTLMNLLPASVLLLFALRKSFLQEIKANSFLKFSLLMLIVHFPVYWLPPGGRQRYIIMLYPFIIQILTYFFLQYFPVKGWRSGFFNKIITIAVAVGAIACLMPAFIDPAKHLPGIRAVSTLSFLFLASIFIFQLIKPRYSIFSLLLSMIIFRMVFNLVVLPVRASEGNAPVNRKAALDIAGITGDKKICILRPTYFPMQSTYYYEKEKGEILPVCSAVEPGQNIITEEYLVRDYSVYRNINTLRLNPLRPFSDPFSGDDTEILSGYRYGTLLSFTLQKRKYLLLEITRPRP